MSLKTMGLVVALLGAVGCELKPRGPTNVYEEMFGKNTKNISKMKMLL